jgi:hypothetical protein
MFRAHATTPRSQGEFHFDVHHSALAEAAIDAAWAAAWLLLWLAFVVTLAQPAPAPGNPAGAGAPASEVMRGGSAHPDPGPSARGVARADLAGAG